MFRKLTIHDFPITFCNNQIVKKMDNRKKRDQKKKTCAISSFKLKDSKNAAKESVKRYLKIREQKFNDFEFELSKSGNIIKRDDIAYISPNKSNIVVSSDSGMILDNVHGNKINRQNPSAIKNINKNKNRLVIELNDYLALTKTKKIAKFQLKPIAGQSDTVNSLNCVDDILKNASIDKVKQILQGGQLTEIKVCDTDQESQRTFLLVPQPVADSANKNVMVHEKQVTKKKLNILKSSESSTPTKTIRKMEQNNRQMFSSQNNRQRSSSQKKDQRSSSQSSSLLNTPKNISLKIVDDNHQEYKFDLPEEKIAPLIKESKKVRNDKRQFNASSGTKPLAQGKMKSNVVLRAHPYFSQHKPFVIKHKPGVTKVLEHQNYSIEYQQESFVESEDNLGSVSGYSELTADIKYEAQDVDFVMLEEGESIDEIFPVALKSSDSDDFEYLKFVADDEISSESEMQILGI